MARQKFSLNSNEKVIMKEGKFRYGRFGFFTDFLIVTNEAVILERYGVFDNFKGIIRYPYNEVKQAIVGKSVDSELQLELFVNDQKEEFVIQIQDKKILKTLCLAINDQLSENAENYDYNFYQNIIEESEKAEREIENKYNQSERTDFSTILNKENMEFVGDVAKNVLKSGNFSMKGIKKGIKKASKKRVTTNFTNKIVDDVLDDIGVHDIQDEFIEIGNDFREMFGIEPKMTNEQRRKLQEKKERRKQAEKYIKIKELERSKDKAFEEQVEKAKQKINS